MCLHHVARFVYVHLHSIKIERVHLYNYTNILFTLSLNCNTKKTHQKKKKKISGVPKYRSHRFRYNTEYYLNLPVHEQSSCSPSPSEQQRTEGRLRRHRCNLPIAIQAIIPQGMILL